MRSIACSCGLMFALPATSDDEPTCRCPRCGALHSAPRDSSTPAIVAEEPPIRSQWEELRRYPALPEVSSVSGPHPDEGRRRFGRGFLTILILGLFFVTLFLVVPPGCQKVRDTPMWSYRMNSIKELVLAIHSYQDIFKRMPANVIYDEQAAKMHSWRVLVLPFVEQNALYNRLSLHSAWDSPDNLPHLRATLSVYADPGASREEDGRTPFQVFDGQGLYKGKPVRALFVSDPGAGLIPTWSGKDRNGRPFQLFESVHGGRLEKIASDGLSNTILLTEASVSVPWAKPADLAFDPQQPLPALGVGMDRDVIFARVDGVCRRINLADISEQTLRQAIMANDGEPLGQDWE